MGRIHALDQSHLLFYVYPLHDHSCYQTTSIEHELHELYELRELHELHELITNYTNC